MSSQGNIKNNNKSKIRNLTNEELLSEQPFYNHPRKILNSQKLSNQELLQVLPFYDDVGVLRRQRAFRNYAETYEVKPIDKKSLYDSLILSKNNVKTLFNDFLRENNGFKYILTTKTTLKKRINNNETLYKTLHSNSEVKAITNERYHLNDSFEKILNSLDIWISEGSGWVIHKVEGFYINVANYEQLSGRKYIPLAKALNNSMKGLINIKNKD